MPATKKRQQKEEVKADTKSSSTAKAKKGGAASPAKSTPKANSKAVLPAARSAQSKSVVKSGKKAAEEAKQSHTAKAPTTKKITTKEVAMPLGPEPKKPRTAYCIFNTEFVMQSRARDPQAKVTDLFKQSGERWNQMTADQKKPYEDQQKADYKLYEDRQHQREKNGFFLFEDGTKSTDAGNSDRVQKVKKVKKDDDAAEKEVKPMAVRSAYTYFVQLFKAPEGTQNIDRMRLAAEKWKTTSEQEKQKYEALSQTDRKRREKQLNDLSTKGFFLMEDGTKSTDVKAKKRRAPSRPESSDQPANKRQKVGVQQKPASQKKSTKSVKAQQEIAETVNKQKSRAAPKTKKK